MIGVICVICGRHLLEVHLRKARIRGLEVLGGRSDEQAQQPALESKAEELHAVTPKRSAERLFESYRRLGRVTGGGGRPWISYVADGGYLWLEHYPGPGPDKVLNAHLHAVFGIYEYWQATRSPAARQLLNGAVTTMRKNLPEYRRPGGISLYGLTTRTKNPKYHEIHIWQLDLLAHISGDGYFARIREICDRYGVLLIMDEVMTGFGRTGEWFAVDRLGIEPDIICMAKGIASGFPFAAVGTRREIDAKWVTGSHSGSSNGTATLTSNPRPTIETPRSSLASAAIRTPRSTRGTAPPTTSSRGTRPTTPGTRRTRRASSSCWRGDGPRSSPTRTPIFTSPSPRPSPPSPGERWLRGRHGHALPCR